MNPAYPAIGLVFLAATIPVATAESLDVKIIDRDNHDTFHSYVVPAHSSSSSGTNVNCIDTVAGVNCSGSTSTSGPSTPARSISYEVRGATLSLLLPDGRVVVANCDSKYALKGDHVNRRSCRVPLTDEIRADFKKDKAKLAWPVSLDGKKFRSETYKILAVFNSPD